MIAVAPAGTTAGGTVTAERGTTTFTSATIALASVVVFVIGFKIYGPMHVSAALPLAVILLPLWLPVLRRYPLAALICALAALSIAVGFALAQRSSVDHHVSRAGSLEAIALVMSFCAALVLLLWAGTKMPLHRVVLMYGAGALAAAVVAGDFRWKFTLAEPTAMVVLALLERKRTGIVPVLVMLGIGILAVASDGRSLFGASILAATLTVWQLRPRSSTGRERRWFPVMLIAGIGLAVYFFTSALATGGVLGTAVQERTTAQIGSEGSLLTGGRPEWAATRALVKLNPLGYGVGVVPNWTDRMTGKEGLLSIGAQVDPFREQYMFGHQFELHSIAADLWVGFGWAGVALAAVAMFALARSLSFALAARRAPTYLSFAVIMALWYVLFGPLLSNWLDVSAALAFALVAGQPSRLSAARGSADAPRAPTRGPGDIPPTRSTLTGGSNAPTR
jgi:hypothetical protein